MLNQRQVAIQCLNRRAYGRAEYNLRHWVLSNPNDVYAHMELILCFYERRNDFLPSPWHRCNEFYDEFCDRSKHKTLRSFVNSEQLFYDNRRDEAIEEYKTTLKLGLAAPTVRHSLGIAFKELERYEEAQKEFEAVLDVEPLFLPTLSTYGRWLFSEGRFGRLDTLLDPLPDMENDDLYLDFRGTKEIIVHLRGLKEATEELCKAICLYNKGKMSEAALAFWPTFRKYKDNYHFIRTMVYLFYRNNWLEFGKLRMRDELGNDGAFARYAEGLILWYEEKNEEALTAYNEVISEGADHPLIHCGKALVLEALDRREEERDELLYAYNRQPWLVHVRAELANNAFEQSDFGKVLEFANLSKAEREYALAYDVSGRANIAQLERLALMALLEQGNVSIALSRIETDPNPVHNARLMFQKSMIYAASGDAQKAEKELSEAIRTDESVIAAADEDDITRINEIAEQIPESFAAAFAYAIRPAYAKDFQEALIRLQELVNRFPMNSRIWCHVGNILCTLGDRHSAKDAYRKAISQVPLNEDALKSLCNVLMEEENIEALLDLSKEVHPEVFPLRCALNLSNLQDKSSQAMGIAHRILEVESDQVDAVLHVLGTMDRDSLEYAQMLERLVSQFPFSFEDRFFIARKFLENGMLVESLKHFEALISDGVSSNEVSISAILQYGLSRLALGVDSSESKNREQKRSKSD